jgi:hypothetical protein
MYRGMLTWVKPSLGLAIIFVARPSTFCLAYAES